MKKLILLPLLVLSMSARLFAETFVYNGIIYEPNGFSMLVGQPTCEVKGFSPDNKDATTLTIPADFAIDPDTQIPYWPISIASNAFADSKLISINSLGTIREIGDYAFHNTYIVGDLTSITVTTVGKYAFANCDALLSVNFAACTTVKDYAFYDCRHLLNATFPLVSTIGDMAFYNCEELTHFELPCSLTSIGRQAFAKCKDIDVTTNMAVISLYTIPYGCFQGCEDLKSFHIPSCVTRIEDYAFDGCSSMDEVSIPDDVEYLGDYSFRNCSALQQVYINGSTTEISSQSPFAGCTAIRKVRLYRHENSVPFNTIFPDCKQSLEWVQLHNGSTSIGKSYEYGWSHTEFGDYVRLSEIDIPEGVTLIGDLAFKNCKSLKKVTLPQSLKTICRYAFEDAGINTLIVPDNVTEIGRGAFQNCVSLRSVTWGNGLTELPWDVCRYDSALTTVDIPANITSIGRDAFASCVALTDIAIRGKQTAWESGYFTNCPAVKRLRIYLDANAPRLSDMLQQSKNSLEEVVLEKGSTHLGTTSDKGHRYSYSTLAGFGKLTRVEIPEGVTMIGSNAFNGDTLLASVILPSTLDTLGDGAFCRTALQSVVLPKSLKEIASQTFYECTALYEVGYTTGLQKIGQSAFYGCTVLTDISLPFSVTEIGSRAYYGCTGVKTVLMGDKMTKIADCAFGYCTAVKSVTCHTKTPLSISGFDSSPFHGINKDATVLYVPASAVDAYKDDWLWNGRFRDVLPIGAVEAETEGIQVSTTATTVTLTWPFSEEAELYHVIILDNNGQVVYELDFDYFGELMDGSYSIPHRPYIPSETEDGYCYTFVGLTPGQTYTYTITAQDEDGNVLSTATGSFKTPGTATDSSESDYSNDTRVRKVMRNGSIYIITLKDEQYNIQGAEVR